jgi:hypothetical protein
LLGARIGPFALFALFADKILGRRRWLDSGGWPAGRREAARSLYLSANNANDANKRTVTHD